MFCSQFFGLLSNTAKTTEFNAYQMSISIRHDNWSIVEEGLKHHKPKPYIN